MQNLLIFNLGLALLVLVIAQPALLLLIVSLALMVIFSKIMCVLHAHSSYKGVLLARRIVKSVYLVSKASISQIIYAYLKMLTQLSLLLY